MYQGPGGDGPEKRRADQQARRAEGGPKHGTVGEIVVMMRAAMVDQQEPEHIQIRSDAARKDAQKDEMWRPESGGRPCGQIPDGQMCDDHETETNARPWGVVG